MYRYLKKDTVYNVRERKRVLIVPFYLLILAIQIQILILN